MPRHLKDLRIADSIFPGIEVSPEEESAPSKTNQILLYLFNFTELPVFPPEFLGPGREGKCPATGCKNGCWHDV
jgi:hypothetical protein